LEISTDPICGFAAPGKRVLPIEGRWASSSMSKGSWRKNLSIAIEMTYPFSRDGALSMPSVASSKVCSRRSPKGK
jgi:hypothetical protein